MAEPDIGVSAAFGYRVGSATTLISDCATISRTGFNVIEYDASTLDHTDYFKRSRPGRIDAGTLSATVRFDPTVYSALQTIARARSIREWFVADPDSYTGGEEAGDGFIQNLGEITYDDQNMLVYTITIRFSDEVAYSAT
jgi:hypothetical protein